MKGLVRRIKKHIANNSHSSDYAEYYLRGCDTMWIGSSLQTFWRVLLSPPLLFCPEERGRKALQKDYKPDYDYTTSDTRRQLSTPCQFNPDQVNPHKDPDKKLLVVATKNKNTLARKCLLMKVTWLYYDCKLYDEKCFKRYHTLKKVLEYLTKTHVHILTKQSHVTRN